MPTHSNILCSIYIFIYIPIPYECLDLQAFPEIQSTWGIEAEYIAHKFVGQYDGISHQCVSQTFLKITINFKYLKIFNVFSKI